MDAPDIGLNARPNDRPYAPVTPWRPLPAVLVTAGALLLSFAIAIMSAVGNSVVFGQPFDMPSATVIGTLAQQATMIVAIWWLAGLHGGNRTHVLGLGAPKGGLSAYVTGAVILLTAVVAMSATIHVIDRNLIKNDLKQFAEILNSPYWWAMYPMVGLGAPLWEELAFRGFLFSALAQSRIGTLGAALVTSAAWAAIHSYSLIGVLQVFAIGMVISYLMIRTGSLRVPLVIHAIYNSVVTTILLTEAGRGFLA